MNYKIVSVLLYILCYQLSFAQSDLQQDKRILNFDHINSYQQNIEVNYIQLKQIGKYNEFKASLSGDNVRFDVIQSGDFNEIDIYSRSNSLDEDILQFGNNNEIIESYFAPHLNIETTVIQNGNNLSFQREGVNSISDNMKIRMTGDNQTVIVRSYK